jgi:transcription antitermination factor NusA-like protein
VEVVLEQIGKQEKRVAALQKELDQEKILLVKLAKAKAALEA